MAPVFVRHNLWWYIKGGSKLKHCKIGNLTYITWGGLTIYSPINCKTNCNGSFYRQPRNCKPPQTRMHARAHTNTYIIKNCIIKAAINWQVLSIWQQTQKTWQLMTKVLFCLADILWTLHTLNLMRRSTHQKGVLRITYKSSDSCYKVISILRRLQWHFCLT